jgi:hypothetical protein
MGDRDRLERLIGIAGMLTHLLQFRFIVLAHLFEALGNCDAHGTKLFLALPPRLVEALSKRHTQALGDAPQCARLLAGGVAQLDIYVVESSVECPFLIAQDAPQFLTPFAQRFVHGGEVCDGGPGEHQDANQDARKHRGACRN